MAQRRMLFMGESKFRNKSCPNRRSWLRLGGAAAVVVLGLMLGAFLSHASAAEKSFTFTAERQQVSIGSELSYPAWTYNGTVPGPLMRVEQGDRVAIMLINHTSDAHGIYSHAAQLNDESFAGPPGAKELSYGFLAQVPITTAPRNLFSTISPKACTE